MQTEFAKQLGIETPIFAFTHCRDVVVAVAEDVAGDDEQVVVDRLGDVAASAAVSSGSDAGSE